MADDKKIESGSHEEGNKDITEGGGDDGIKAKPLAQDMSGKTLKRKKGKYA